MIAPHCQFPVTLNRRWTGAALAAIVALALPLLAATPIAAQSRDIQPLINTVDRLERQLQALERAVYRGGAQASGAPGVAVGDGSVPPAAMAQLQLKTSQLEEQMRGLTGQIEEMGNEVRKISGRLDRLVADVDFRLRALETANGGTGPVPSAVAPLRPEGAGDLINDPAPVPGAPRVIGTIPSSQLEAAGIAPSGSAASQADAGAQAATQQATASAGDSASLPPGSPEDRYNYARSFLMRRDFDGAEQALRAFVDTYPDTELAGNAQYWLGETYYVRKDYGAAARTFADGFQRYPGSNKAPDNLLKLGMSLAALERNDDACITFAKLASEYPQAPANIKRLADQESARLKCP